MVKTINFPYILTVFLTYFLATVIISAIKEDTVISLKSKNTKKLVKILCVELILHNIKTRKLSQHSKKLNCPVQFSVKKLYRFPEYKISKDTSWQRSSTSKKIKLVLQQLSIKKAASDDKVPGYLYVTKFPKGHYFDFLIYDLFIYFCFIYYSSTKVKLVPSGFGIANHITNI